MQDREAPRGRLAVALIVMPVAARHRDERREPRAGGRAHQVTLRGPRGHEAAGRARHVQHLVARRVAPERTGEDALPIAAVLVRVADQNHVELERRALVRRRGDGKLARARVIRRLVPKRDLGVLAGLEVGERLTVGALDGEDREIGVVERLPRRQPRALHALANVAAPAPWSGRWGRRSLLLSVRGHGVRIARPHPSFPPRSLSP